MKAIIKSFLAGIINAIRNMPDATMVRYVIQESDALQSHFMCFPKLIRKYLQELVNVWSTGEKSVRGQAFAAIYHLSKEAPANILDDCLKTSYTTFVKHCKNVNAHNASGIQMMIDSLTDLYLLDQKMSYQHAFLYIRQMAIHLRTALTAKVKEAYRGVYNWQFLNCLRFWSNLLATSYAKKPDNPLRPLIYPLVQIGLGAARHASFLSCFNN